MNAAMDMRAAVPLKLPASPRMPASKMRIRSCATSRVLVKNAILSSRFSPEQFDFKLQLSGRTHPSLISDNRMTHLFNRDTGPVVCNVAAETAIKVQRQGSCVARSP
jgi:hypothetical protein